MANLTIHNLDESITNNLRAQAQQHGRSVEEEVQQILRLTFSDTSNKASGLGSKISKRFMEVGGVELPQPTRSQPRQSADSNLKSLLASMTEELTDTDIARLQDMPL